MNITSDRFKPSTDLVTFEVLRHRLWQINDEQGRSIINVSGSPVASEVNDFNVGLADAAGNLVCLGPYNLFHVSSIGLMIRNAQKLFGQGRQVREGDIYICNDPWMGAVHHSDVCLIAPVFYEGELRAWASSTIHQVDIGGVAPGSWNPLARDTFQEAPRYRFLKVVRDGEVQPEVVETYLTNSRTPHLLELDLRAQIAAANVARDRLRLLFTKYDVQVVQSVMNDMLDYTEYLLRKKLSEIPDGKWYSEDYLDHSGNEEKIHAIRLSLTKKDTKLIFDFRGTDVQADGPINSTYGGILGGLFAALGTFICNDIPWNDGALRPIEILSEEGTLNNAAFPAACGMGTISGCLHTGNACSSAIAKMLSCSEIWRKNLMGVWAGAAFVFNVFGKNQYGEKFGTMMVNSHMGGGGARYFADGYDNSGSLNVPRASITNVESAESIYPILYLYRRRAIDSGGAGRYRGGVSGENAITPYGTDRLDVVVSTLGCNHSSSAGICGGYPGGGAHPLLKRGTDIINKLKNGAPPACWEDIPGEEFVLQAKESFVLKPGDVFNGVPHGGGGFGDPIERDPKLVQRDVSQYLVSIEFAKSVYGVALDASTLKIQSQETENIRREIRKKRIAAVNKEAELRDVPEKWRDFRNNEVRFGETLRVRKNDVVCARCGAKIALLGSNPKKGAIEIRSHLQDASPRIAKRWKGESPDFVFVRYICPGCGFIIDAAQRRSDEVDAWEDYLLDSVNKNT